MSNNKRIRNDANKYYTEQSKDVHDVRSAADNITDQLDKQAVENFQLNLQVNKYRSELRHALQQLDEHTYCPGDVDIQCQQDKQNICQQQCKPAQPTQPVQPQPEVEQVHGPDCHCSKCCPNPNPNFFQKHRMGILLGVLWVAIIVLALGLSPSGAAFETIQNSWVELIVNFFKMGIFAIAGIVTYNLVKNEKVDKKDS